METKNYDMEILQQELVEMYGIAEPKSEEILLDLTKEKAAHSQQIRDFYDAQQVVNLKLTLGYISNLLVEICDELQYNVEKQFIEKNAKIMNLLKLKGKAVLQTILDVAAQTLQEYKENFTNYSECSNIEVAICNLYVSKMRKISGYEVLIDYIQ